MNLDLIVTTAIICGTVFLTAVAVTGTITGTKYAKEWKNNRCKCDKNCKCNENCTCEK